MNSVAHSACTRDETPHILFVEDDTRLSDFLQRYFTEQGFVAQVAHDGTAMQHTMAQQRFDVVVLDLGLPGRDDGFSLARELKRGPDLGILFLSASQDALDRIVALEIGADDFVVKPFEPRELLARVRAVIRRLRHGIGDAASAASPSARHDTVGHRVTSQTSNSITFDDCQIDFDRQVLIRRDGNHVLLSSHEFNLLAALAKRPGRVLSRDQLLDLTVGRNWSPYDRSIDMMIAKIRRKIGDHGPHFRRIRTIRGTGYMFLPDP